MKSMLKFFSISVLIDCETFFVLELLGYRGDAAPKTA